MELVQLYLKKLNKLLHFFCFYSIKKKFPILDPDGKMHADPDPQP